MKILYFGWNHQVVWMYRAILCIAVGYILLCKFNYGYHTRHFSAVKLTMCYEKNMSSLIWCQNLQKFEKSWNIGLGSCNEWVSPKMNSFHKNWLGPPDCKILYRVPQLTNVVYVFIVHSMYMASSSMYPYDWDVSMLNYLTLRMDMSFTRYFMSEGLKCSLFFKFEEK